MMGWVVVSVTADWVIHLVLYTRLVVQRFTAVVLFYSCGTLMACVENVPFKNNVQHLESHH